MTTSTDNMAFAMYVADHPDTAQSWDDLLEEDQEAYWRRANAIFKHLFEHGRISSYISHKTLDKLKAEYQEYLEKVNK